MKMKTMAMLAASGLMAASLAFITPALAEDGFEDGMAPQQLAMADTSGSAMQGDLGPNANETQAGRFETAANNQDRAPANQQQNINAQQPQAQAMNQASQAANVASPANDQPTADVASGDEDF